MHIDTRCFFPCSYELDQRFRPPLVAHTWCDSILQGALIEDVRGESTERRVHTVLHLETYGSYAQYHQPLKQGLGQTSSGCLLAHDHRSKLAVVTYQDQLQQQESN